jgi:hypothetical protein
MQTHEFYQAFANTPMADRTKHIEFKDGDLTLDRLFEKIHDLDEMMQKPKARQAELLKLADEYYTFKTAKFRDEKAVKCADENCDDKAEKGKDFCRFHLENLPI